MTLYLRFRWFGLPRIEPSPYNLSPMRYDRSKFPRLVPLSDDDRRVIAGLTDDCLGAPHSDVLRVTYGIRAWRGVTALYAVREPYRMTRWGIDTWLDLGRGIREYVVRFYRTPKPIGE